MKFMFKSIFSGLKLNKMITIIMYINMYLILHCGIERPLTDPQVIRSIHHGGYTELFHVFVCGMMHITHVVTSAGFFSRYLSDIYRMPDAI